MITDDYSKELYHYGVKGMKWGVRRAIKKKSKGRNKICHKCCFDRT